MEFSIQSLSPAQYQYANAGTGQDLNNENVPSVLSLGDIKLGLELMSACHAIAVGAQKPLEQNSDLDNEESHAQILQDRVAVLEKNQALGSALRFLAQASTSQPVIPAPAQVVVIQAPAPIIINNQGAPIQAVKKETEEERKAAEEEAQTASNRNAIIAGGIALAVSSWFIGKISAQYQEIQEEILEFDLQKTAFSHKLSLFSQDLSGRMSQVIAKVEQILARKKTDKAWNGNYVIAMCIFGLGLLGAGFISSTRGMKCALALAIGATAIRLMKFGFDSADTSLKKAVDFVKREYPGIKQDLKTLAAPLGGAPAYNQLPPPEYDDL